MSPESRIPKDCRLSGARVGGTNSLGGWHYPHSAGYWPRLPRDGASLATSCHLLGAGSHCANPGSFLGLPNRFPSLCPPPRPLFC